MARKGWVKFHRSILDNNIFKNDPTAWRVFEVCLLLCDEKGELSIGSKQLAEQVGCVASTAFRAVNRLLRTQMVQCTTQRKFRIIKICNWGKYQHRDATVGAPIGAISTQRARTHYKNRERRATPLQGGSSTALTREKNAAAPSPAGSGLALVVSEDQLNQLDAEFPQVDIDGSYQAAAATVAFDQVEVEDSYEFLRSWIIEAESGKVAA